MSPCVVKYPENSSVRRTCECFSVRLENLAGFARGRAKGTPLGARGTFLTNLEVAGCSFLQTLVHQSRNVACLIDESLTAQYDDVLSFTRFLRHGRVDSDFEL